MTGKYEIRIGKCLQIAWENFLKGPEVFVIVTFAFMALFYLLGRLPALGGVCSLLLSAAVLPSFLLLAEDGRLTGKVGFGSLTGLRSIAPKAVALFFAKTFLVSVGLLLLFLPGLYLMVAFLYAESFAVLERKPFWASMRESRALAHRNLTGTLSLLLVCFMILLSGAMVVGVGLLAAIPLTALLLHAVFHDIQSQA